MPFPPGVEPVASDVLLTACSTNSKMPLKPNGPPRTSPAGQVKETVTSTAAPLATRVADVGWIDASAARTVIGTTSAASTPRGANRIMRLTCFPIMGCSLLETYGASRHQP